MTTSLAETLAFRALVRTLVDPRENWTEGHYTIDNIKLGIEVWTAGAAVLGTNLYKPGPLNLSLAQRWKLRRAVHIARANQLTRMLERARGNTDTERGEG